MRKAASLLLLAFGPALLAQATVRLHFDRAGFQQKRDARDLRDVAVNLAHLDPACRITREGQAIRIPLPGADPVKVLDDPSEFTVVRDAKGLLATRTQASRDARAEAFLKGFQAFCREALTRDGAGPEVSVARDELSLAWPAGATAPADVLGILRARARVEIRLAPAGTDDRKPCATREAAMAGQNPGAVEAFPHSAGGSTTWVPTERKGAIPGRLLLGGSASRFAPTGAWDIRCQFGEEGTRAFRALTATAAKASRKVVILAGGRVVSVLRCLEPIPGGSVRITGAFTPEEAQALAFTFEAAAAEDLVSL